MKTTLRDVAKKTGMSITTVSRALNGHDDVSVRTREKVHSAATDLGYTPNLNARRLKTQRADAIGLILPSEHLSMSDPFFSDLFSGIIETAAQDRLELNVNSAPSDGDGGLYLEYIRSQRVDGFILVRVQWDDPRVALLLAHDVPFVAFGRTADPNYAWVDEDSEQGIRAVIDHLVELGHRRIACISEPLHLAKSHQRLLGYKHGLHAHGLPLDETLIVEGRFRQRSGMSAAHQLLDLPHPPTAIVAVNDLIAIGAMGAAVERGLTIGRDISITGFDNIMLAEYTNPPLTTIHQPAHKMGVLLCKTLIGVIRGDDAIQKQHLLPSRLIVRKSTGRVRFSTGDRMGINSHARPKASWL